MQMNDGLGIVNGIAYLERLFLAPHILGYVGPSLSLVYTCRVKPRGSPRPAGHVIYSRVGRGLRNRATTAPEPELRRQLFFYETDTQGDGVASWPLPARVLVHAPPVPSPIRVSHILVNDVHCSKCSSPRQQLEHVICTMCIYTQVSPYTHTCANLCACMCSLSCVSAD